MNDPKTAPVAALNFEDALAELEQIVSELERGETPLEQTIARFERGVALARRCEDRLNEADRTVAMLLQEGARVVEVDLESGERLRSRPDPGEAAIPESAPTPPPTPPPTRRTRPLAPSGPQLSLENPSVIRTEREMGDDDIPF